MHVFITGGTGLVGTAVIAELLAHDHRVTALARSEASAARVRQAGAEVLAGALSDLDTLRAGAEAADGVIHLAFSHDFSTQDALARSIAEESAALSTLGATLVGSNRPLVTVSGTPRVPGRAAIETDPILTAGAVGGRGQSVMAALALADRGVRVSAVRLPRTVHNQGRGGFAGLLAHMARKMGISGVPGDGEQRWPSVHAVDAAALFRLALEKAEAGTAWHAVGQEGERVADIAAVIGRRLGLPVQPIPAESFGPFGPLFAADQPASSRYTQEALGWKPTHAALLDDLELIEP